MTAGRPVTLPVFRLNLEPCCGHSTSQSSTISPPLKRKFSCVQTSSRAKKPSSQCPRQISWPSAMTPFTVSIGTSSTDATRCLANPRLQLCLDHRARVRERDAVEHVAEEALDKHPLGGQLWDAPRAEVKEVLGVDRSDGRAVRAADVVVVDLEHRDRGRLGLVAQDEVSIRLVRVRAGGVLLDPDQPRVDRARHVLKRALEEQVGPRVADSMVLQGVEVEELLAR